MEQIKIIAHEVAAIGPKIGRKIHLDSLKHVVELPPSQLFTIMIIHEKKQCNFSELRRALNVTAPTVTGVIDRLERLDYCHRTPDKNDRRSINITLTQEGKKIAKKIKNSLEKNWEAILSKMSTKDARHLLAILRKIERII